MPGMGGVSGAGSGSGKGSASISKYQINMVFDMGITWIDLLFSIPMSHSFF